MGVDGGEDGGCQLVGFQQVAEMIDYD